MKQDLIGNMLLDGFTALYNDYGQNFHKTVTDHFLLWMSSSGSIFIGYATKPIDDFCFPNEKDLPLKCFAIMPCAFSKLWDAFVEGSPESFKSNTCVSAICTQCSECMRVMNDISDALNEPISLCPDANDTCHLRCPFAETCSLALERVA